MDRDVEVHFSDRTEEERANTVLTSRQFDAAPSATRPTEQVRLIRFAAQQLANERLRVSSEHKDLEVLRVEMNDEIAQLEKADMVQSTLSIDGEALPSVLLDVGARQFGAAVVQDVLVMVSGDADFVSSKFVSTTQVRTFRLPHVEA
ncbi:hypothetical protein [Clavibacter michiganensis]|nr:hypothetical protein [Clavibacter michiganensis]